MNAREKAERFCDETIAGMDPDTKRQLVAGSAHHWSMLRAEIDQKLGFGAMGALYPILRQKLEADRSGMDPEKLALAERLERIARGGR